MNPQLPSIGPFGAQHSAQQRSPALVPTQALSPVQSVVPVPDIPSQRELAEDRAWARLYRNVHQPAAAAAIVDYMLKSPEAIERNEALYLLACQTLHNKQLSDDQNERILALFREIFVGVPMGILKLLKTGFIGASKVFSPSETESKATKPKAKSATSQKASQKVDPKVETPVVSKTKSHVGALSSDPVIAQAIVEFKAGQSTQASMAEAPDIAEPQDSRSSKAA